MLSNNCHHFAKNIVNLYYESLGEKNRMTAFGVFLKLWCSGKRVGKYKGALGFVRFYCKMITVLLLMMFIASAAFLFVF